ncbi:hypothetical protein GTA08_BOTSDO07851 [Neofusicoccum parvum]|nr:hypothetical protein GTA08_BOTSDO07851 [Neofusicoccum parvum]
MPSSLRERAALPLSRIQERGRRLLCLGQETRSDDAPSTTAPPSSPPPADSPPTRRNTHRATRPHPSTTTTPNRPPSPYFLVHPTRCHHAYPAPPASYLALAGRIPALCPHCAIAAPDDNDDHPRTAAARQPRPIPALICGHALTVRRRTAAILDANPLVFAAPGAGANLLARSPRHPAAGYTVAVEERGSARRRRAWAPPPPRLLGVEVGQPAVLEVGARVMRANFNREYCVGCLRERYRVALARQEGARRRLEGLVEEGEGEGIASAEGRVLAEQERVWRARVGAWRVWLSVLEAEEELALAGREGAAAGRRKRDSGFGEGFVGGRRRGSGGSWSVRSLSARSLSARSLSWRSRPGSGKGERVGEGVVHEGRGKKKVTFDESCKDEDEEGRHFTRFDRKSKWYKKGKYTVRKPLDTSGWGLTDEKDIRRWYSPPLGSSECLEKDRSVSTKKRWWI